MAVKIDEDPAQFYYSIPHDGSCPLLTSENEGHVFELYLLETILVDSRKSYSNLWVSQ